MLIFVDVDGKIIVNQTISIKEKKIESYKQYTYVFQLYRKIKTLNYEQ